jgi:hypothetical protein
MENDGKRNAVAEHVNQKIPFLQNGGQNIEMVMIFEQARDLIIARCEPSI